MIVIIGASHKHTSFAQLAKISFTHTKIVTALDYMRKHKTVSGCVIVSTCNRVEFYFNIDSADSAQQEINLILRDFCSIPLDALPHSYLYTEQQAVSHLYAVCAGLDSMVIGETQILGQIKEAFFTAEKHGMIDPYLRRIFHKAFSMAKKIHTSTRISAGKVSIGSVAIDFIKAKLGSLSNSSILLIGVGKVTELVVKYLQKESPNILFVANRSFDKAQQFASRIGGHAYHFDSLDKALRSAHIIISATSCPGLILYADRVNRALSNLSAEYSHHRYFIDLALPNDIDPEIEGIDNVSLYGLEQISSIVQRNIECKIKKAKQAQHLIDVQVKRLWNNPSNSVRAQVPSP